MPNIDAKKLEELRSLLAKATPGPWSATEKDGRFLFKIMSSSVYVAETSWHDASPIFPTKEGSKANFDLIVAMRNTLPALLDLAERGIKCGQPDNPIASIDEGAPRPETWKERAENRQAVFLLAKRRAEAAETRAEELEKALDREIAHADELRQSATSATMREAWDVAYTSLRRARTALEDRE